MYKIIIFCMAIICSTSAISLNKAADDSCGYSACHATDPNKLNVHMIAHSHNDVGWLHPADHSYWNEVDYIISSVVSALQLNSNWRFSQTEQYFFHKWWIQQNDETRGIVKKLVNSGRLEMVNGGWSSNDEAITHYQSTIDQLTLGHRFLEEELGSCSRSRVGWQIDTYGHSNTQAQIYSQMGMDSMMFSRYDFRDDEKRKQSKTTDFLWTSSAKNIGNESNIFTSAIYRAYNYPGGFCYDDDCDDKLNDLDDPTLNNIEERVKAFTEYITAQADAYPSNNILITMGDDMKYKNAYYNFKTMDKIIKGFNDYKQTYNGKEIQLLHSTPSCYAKAVNDYFIKNNKTLDVKTDDFFPHASSGLPSYWNGYYTSRPTSKRYERIGNNLLQVSKQLATFANLSRDENFSLESAIGIMQHHDAITGTEDEHVQKSYHALISAAIDLSIKSDDKALSVLLGLDPLTQNLELKHCPLANVSICPHTKVDEFNIITYNPLGESSKEHIELSVDEGPWIVTDPNGNEINYLLTTPIRDYSYVAQDLGVTLNSHLLVFTAENIPSMGFNVYNVKKSAKMIKKQHIKTLKDFKKGETIGFKDNNYVVIDIDTGFITKAAINGLEIELTQEIMYYHSDYDYSGTWMFRPDGTVRDAQKITDIVDVNVIENSDFVEIRQLFNEWAAQVIRIYPDEDYIEFNWNIGPVSIEDNIGKDIISRFTTNLDSGDLFYTDSNSREIVQRRRDSRPTFDIDKNQEPVTQNYYPVSSRIFIDDVEKDIQFGVITDRGEGASSLKSGQLELMIQRGTLRKEGDVGTLYEYEYGKGVNVRGSHYITIGKKTGNKNSIITQRKLVQHKHLKPWKFLTTSNVPVKNFTLLIGSLPKNVHLLTLSKWNDKEDTYILRLEHLFEKDEDEKLSQDVTVDLKGLFTTFEIHSIQETALNGVIPLEAVMKLTWPQFLRTNNQYEKIDNLSVILKPMQIRTFIIKVTYK